MRLSFLACLGAALSCDKPKGDGGEATIVFTEASNYVAESTIDLGPPVVTASGVDLELCWEGLTSDIRCQDVEESDVVAVSMLKFSEGVSPEEVQTALAEGQPVTSILNFIQLAETSDSSTCVSLSEMEFGGNMIDVAEDYVESDSTYLVLFSHSKVAGQGALSMTFVEPQASGSETTVTAPQGCGLLTFDADINEDEPVAVPTDGPWIVDWSALSKDAQGNAFPSAEVETLLIGFYEGKTVEELEADIFNLESSATHMWELDVEGKGTRADLSMATHREDGDAFSGFGDHDDGVWIAALICTACQNPTPMLISVLEPE